MERAKGAWFSFWCFLFFKKSTASCGFCHKRRTDRGSTLFYPLPVNAGFGLNAAKRDAISCVPAPGRTWGGGDKSRFQPDGGSSLLSRLRLTFPVHRGIGICVLFSILSSRLICVKAHLKGWQGKSLEKSRKGLIPANERACGGFLRRLIAGSADSPRPDSEAPPDSGLPGPVPRADPYPYSCRSLWRKRRESHP